jgi:PAS domain-containing protein
VRVEILNRGKHGRSFWVDLDIQPLRDAAGTLTGFIQVTTDITAQVERREYLDAILRALPAGLLVQDAQGRIVDANLKAEQLLGHAARRADRPRVLRSRAGPRWRRRQADRRHRPARDAPRCAPASRRTIGPWACARRRPAPLAAREHPDPARPAGVTQGVISCFLDETEVRAQRNLLRTTIDGAGRRHLGLGHAPAAASTTTTAGR